MSIFKVVIIKGDEIMDKNIYLFYGFNGEYVLNPLYKEMIKRGYNCVEIDTAYEKDIKGKLDTLKGKDVILVTCAHVFFDKQNLKDIYPIYPDSISVLEVIDYLKPVKKIYYPHDIMDGFTHIDKDYFSLFDCYLSPLPCNAHGNRYCPVIDVGWIKKNKIMSTRSNSGKNIKINHGLGFFEFYREDLESMYNTFQKIWNFNAKVKLPSGQLYRDDYEKFFKNKNIVLYEDNANIYDLIDESDIVITNAVTAVSIEASLSGRKVINIYDENTRISLDYQKKLILGFPNVSIKTPDEAVSYITDMVNSGEVISSGKDIMNPFDMEKTIKIITGELNVK